MASNREGLRLKMKNDSEFFQYDRFFFSGVKIFRKCPRCKFTTMSEKKFGIFKFWNAHQNQRFQFKKWLNYHFLQKFLHFWSIFWHFFSLPEKEIFWHFHVYRRIPTDTDSKQHNVFLRFCESDEFVPMCTCQKGLKQTIFCNVKITLERP